jgi:hypothetical protein
MNYRIRVFFGNVSFTVYCIEDSDKGIEGFLHVLEHDCAALLLQIMKTMRLSFSDYKIPKTLGSWCKKQQIKFISEH